MRDARIVTDRLSRRSKGCVIVKVPLTCSIGYVELSDAKYVPLALRVSYATNRANAQLSGSIVMGVPIIIQPTEAERNREGKTIEQLVAEAT